MQTTWNFRTRAGWYHCWLYYTQVYHIILHAKTLPLFSQEVSECLTCKKQNHKGEVKKNAKLRTDVYKRLQFYLFIFLSEAKYSVGIAVRGGEKKNTLNDPMKS